MATMVQRWWGWWIWENLMEWWCSLDDNLGKAGGVMGMAVWKWWQMRDQTKKSCNVALSTLWRWQFNVMGIYIVCGVSIGVVASTLNRLGSEVMAMRFLPRGSWEPHHMQQRWSIWLSGWLTSHDGVTSIQIAHGSHDPRPHTPCAFPLWSLFTVGYLDVHVSILTNVTSG